MEIIFTQHAIERMVERKVNKKEVKEALIKADRYVIKDAYLIAVKLIEKGLLLIVVYRKIEQIYKVITVIKSSKLEKYL